MSTTPSVRRRLSILLISIAVAGGACGIDYDDSPRALSVEATTTTAVPTQSSGQFGATLYYVLKGALMPVNQELEDRAIDTSIRALLQPPTSAGQVEGLSTSIPAGTELIGTDERERTVFVDLSSAFDNVVGLSRQQAIGQIVMTVTEGRAVDSMVFSVEGDTIMVLSPDRGDVTEVFPCDFASLLATADDALGSGLGTASALDIQKRRAEFDETCESTTTESSDGS